MAPAVLSGLVVVSLAFTSCVGRPELFAPTEHATATMPEGEPAAEYDVVADGDMAGEARVWSRGAFEQEEDDGEHTVLHVAFALESADDAQMTLETDKVTIEGTAGDRRFIVRDPSQVEGNAVARRGGETEIHLYFPVPTDLAPRELDAFRVRWSVVSEGARYGQRTPFRKQAPAANGNDGYGVWGTSPWPF